MTQRPDPPPGLRAMHPGTCTRCDQPISPGDRIVYRHGHPIHCSCASGADDE